MSSTHLQHRRIGGPPRPPKSSATIWKERAISAFVTLFVLGGFAVVIWSVAGGYIPHHQRHLKTGGVSGGSSAVSAAALKPKNADLTPETIDRYRKAAKVLNAEVMAPIPEKFDDGYKNPCWTAADGQFRCLPYAYVAGQFHAGALGLSERLKRHPDIATDVCSQCQFWAEEAKLMSFYLDNMKAASVAIKAAPQNKVLLDHSPSTFGFYWAGGQKAHMGFQEAMRPCYEGCVQAFNKDKVEPVHDCMGRKCYNSSLAADRGKAATAGIDYETEQHNPLLIRAVYGARPPKMIVLVREPIARLYSAYHNYPHYHTKYGKSSAGFTAYVKEQVGAFRDCARDYGEERCALVFEALGSREEKIYFHADQLMRGMYGLFLEIWQRFIPPSHWLIIDADEYFNNEAATLERVVDFLGLTKANETVMKDMTSLPKAPTYASGQEPIQPEAKKILKDLYKPYNTKLAQVTGDPRYEKWNRDEL
ncbi:hypothetical protein HYH03_001123 [Edaphochlamys debaryana]|uniref:Sulfotransferase n=1 Tax=Edaphochlamys debaryana TaxID=47281 RepID=A0A835YEC9_9CHLO|nr:hypothetical protein HYH03_001123 [Edaphochlamys debaryana]|eukprot:KAG2501332.1 hypothetical protein HYH03_001123 [Edaphochlamys debaryana]